jgi:Fe-S oxidoreductase
VTGLGDAGVTREILWNVPGGLRAAFYALALLAVLGAAAGFAGRWRRRARGRADPGRPLRHPAWGRRLAAVAGYLALHRELRRDPYAGLAHLLTVYGFAVLFLGTCLVFLEHETPLHFFYGGFYLGASLLVDLGGLAFVAGLTLFLWRRHAPGAPGRARLRQDWATASLAWLLLAIALTGFLLEAARIARDLPPFERWSVAGYALALGLRAAGLAGEATLPWHRGLWAVHALLSVAFLALLPWRFFGHLALGAASWAARTARPLGALPAAAGAPGPPWTAFSRSDLLQAEACTTCGRCDAVCPAHAAGKPLSPRGVVLALRAAMAAGDGAAPPVPDGALWSCTTCTACTHACPVGIEVFEKVVAVRRGRVEAGDLPPAALRVLDASVARATPFDRPAAERLAWAAGLDVPVAREGEAVELLYWVGCAGAFDPDGRRVTRAVATLLGDLGLPYRVLGPRERCTGDPARRMGEEGLFEELARANLETLAGHGVRKVITHCPHCYHAFTRDYRALGGAFEVEHHSQLLARLLAAGRLRLPGPAAAGGPAPRVTYHDPCYLGRAAGETAAPRAVLAALLGRPPVEMPRHGAETFCCGAGGGAMWLDVKGRERVETIRAREAAATGADVVVTACPFCQPMLRAGRQGLPGGGQGLEVRDLAELVVEARAR